MPVRAVLFDVDGTLIDSVPLHAQAWIEALENAGLRFDVETLLGLVGMGGPKIMTRLIGEAGKAGAARDVPRLQALIFKERFISKAKPFPKVTELLLELARRRIRRYLVGTSDREILERYLVRFKLGGLVDSHLCDSDVPEGRPAPDLYLTALHRFGLEPHQAVAVGDSPYDVEAARRARLDVVAVLSGGYAPRALAGSRLILESPAELLARLDEVLVPGQAYR
ncbi:MAG: HAD family phosphatase [Planctomycetota bacterium]